MCCIIEMFVHNLTNYAAGNGMLQLFTRSGSLLAIGGVMAVALLSLGHLSIVKVLAVLGIIGITIEIVGFLVRQVARYFSDS
jgi:hypothetical protein